MKDVKKTDYNELVKKIQEDIPNLYRELRLDLQIYIKNIYIYEIDTHYILIHSSIEYFIKKEMNNGNT